MLDLSRTRGSVVLNGLFATAAVAHLFTFLSSIYRYTGYEIGKSFLADDTFYYLVIANNIASGHGSTFDGIAATNGYHPLWLAICVVIASLTPHNLQIEVIYAVQGLLVLVAAVALRSGLARIDPFAATVTASLFLASGSVRFVLMNGMESALGAALLTTFLLWVLIKENGHFLLSGRRDVLTATGLLAAIALTRLEMAICCVSFLCWQYAVAPTKPSRTSVLAVAGGLAAIGATYLIANLLIVQWPVPISGSVKWAGEEAPAVFARTAHFHLSTFLRLINPTGASLGVWLEAFIAAAMLALVMRLSWASPRLQRLSILVLLPCLVFVVVAINRSGGFAWYGWPALIAGTLSTFALIHYINVLATSARLRLLSLSLPNLLAYGVASLVLAEVIALATHRFIEGRPTQLFDWSTPEVLMDQTLAEIRERIPVNEQIAGTSVGLLSFESRRSIIQAEGLVNDKKYFFALREGRAREVLSERGTRWFIAVVHDRSRRFPEFFSPDDIAAVHYASGYAATSLLAGDDVKILKMRWNTDRN